MRLLRRLPRFEYLQPSTVAEACQMLSRYGEAARVLAGGTDLLVIMKNREIKPQYIIALSGLKGLDYIENDKAHGLRIGAMATIQAIATSPVVAEKFPGLAYAASRLGNLQVRTRATIGGNLCNAAPSADTASPLLCLGARAKIAGPAKERVVPLEEFFTGSGQTVLKKGEILTEIQVDNPPAHSGASYFKFTRTAVDLAIVGVGALVALSSKGGPCRQVRLALAGVASTPLRARKAEAALEGKKPTEAAIAETGKLAAAEAQPRTSIRSTAEYRREMVAVLTRRALRQALELAEQS